MLRPGPVRESCEPSTQKEGNGAGTDWEAVQRLSSVVPAVQANRNGDLILRLFLPGLGNNILQVDFSRLLDSDAEERVEAVDERVSESGLARAGNTGSSGGPGVSSALI